MVGVRFSERGCIDTVSRAISGLQRTVVYVSPHRPRTTPHRLRCYSRAGERLDTRNPSSKLMLTILARVATWEREIMLEKFGLLCVGA
jgi:hypothetical protein